MRLEFYPDSSALFYKKYEENYKNIWILGYLIVYLHCVMVATAI